MSEHSKHVFTPLEVANAGYKEAERIQNSTGTGIDMPKVPGSKINEYFTRVMPWEVTAIIGQTHNGKTLLADWWEDGACHQLKEEGREDEVVVHISLEESLEAMSFQQHSKFSGVPVADIASGNVDLAKLRMSTKTIAGINIFRIADSIQVEDDEMSLTLSNIYRVLRSLQSGVVTGSPVKIAAVWLDYLQALPYDDEVKSSREANKRRLQVRNDTYRLRKMTVHLGAPIFVNVQAKQELSHARAPYYIPGIYDGEETSAIGQRFDRIIGIWMPKVDSYRVGEHVQELGTVTEEMFYVKVIKQRGFPSGKTFLCKWDFENHKLIDLYGEPNGKR